MADETAFTQTCVCGRVFSDLGAFTRHEKGCRKGKKRLSSALAKAKEVYRAKKAKLSAASSRSSLDGANTGSSAAEGATAMPEEQLTLTLHQVSVRNTYFFRQMGLCYPSQTSSESSHPQSQVLPEDDDLPLAQRRS